MHSAGAGTGWPYLDIGTQIEWQPLIEYALRLCNRWHWGMLDRAGRPYAEHPIEVARRVWEETRDPAAQCVALLHDTIEDTEMPSDLLMAFPESVQLGVWAMTRGKEESAGSYINRVLADRLACKVKVHDIEHNFSPMRADAKILAKASMYAQWHRECCAQLGIDRSFCAINPEVQSSCECTRCIAKRRLRGGDRNDRLSANTDAGYSVHSVRS